MSGNLEAANAKSEVLQLREPLHWSGSNSLVPRQVCAERVNFAPSGSELDQILFGLG